MLECDTKLRSSHLTKGLLWLVDTYLPAIAFNHLLIGLRNQPDEAYAEKAWAAMSENYEIRARLPSKDEQINLKPWIRIVLHVWGLREALLRQQNRAFELPRIVLSMRSRMGLMSSDGEQLSSPLDVNGSDSQLRMLMELESFAAQGLTGYPEIPGQGVVDVGVEQFWTNVDWTQIHTQEW